MLHFHSRYGQHSLHCICVECLLLFCEINRNKPKLNKTQTHCLLVISSSCRIVGFWPGCLYVSVFSAALPQNPDNHARLEAPQSNLLYQCYQRQINKLFFILSVLKYTASQYNILVIFKRKVARITHWPACTEPGHMTDQND